MTKQTNWKPTEMGNYVLMRRGWAISYNPDISASAKLSPFGFLNDFPVEEFKTGTVSNEETALILNVKNGNKYAILNGDFRKNYTKIKTKKDAIKFYKSKKDEFGSAWSTI